MERQLLEKSDKVVVVGGNFEWTQSASFIEISTVGNMLELLAQKLTHRLSWNSKF